MSDFVPFEPCHLCGWVNHPAGVAYQLSRMPYPYFRTAAANLMGADADRDLLVYKAWKDVLGSYPDYHRQEIGDCTSFGSGHNVDLTECVQIALGGGRGVVQGDLHRGSLRSRARAGQHAGQPGWLLRSGSGPRGDRGGRGPA